MFENILKESTATIESVAGKGGFGNLGEQLGKNLGEAVGRGVASIIGGGALVEQLAGLLGLGVAKVLQSQETLRMLGARLAPAVAGGVPGAQRMDYSALGLELGRDLLELRLSANLTGKEVEAYIQTLGRLGFAWDNQAQDMVQYLEGLKKIGLYSEETTRSLLQTASTKYGAAEQLDEVTQAFSKAAEVFNSKLEDSNKGIYRIFTSQEFLASSFREITAAGALTGMSMEGLSKIYTGLASSLLVTGFRPDQVLSHLTNILTNLFPKSGMGMEGALTRTYMYKKAFQTGSLGNYIWALLLKKARELELPESLAASAFPVLMAERPDLAVGATTALLHGFSKDQQSGMSSYNEARKIERLLGIPYDDAWVLTRLSQNLGRIIDANPTVNAEDALNAMLTDPEMKNAVKGTKFEGMTAKDFAGVLAKIAPEQRSIEESVKIWGENALLMAQSMDKWGSSYWDQYMLYGDKMFGIQADLPQGATDPRLDIIRAAAEGENNVLRRQVRALKNLLKEQVHPGRAAGGTGGKVSTPERKRFDAMMTIPVGSVPISGAGGVSNINYTISEVNKMGVKERVRKFATQAGVNPNLAESLAWQESRFNPNAVSPVGARGTMQIMPFNIPEFEKKFGPSNEAQGVGHLGELLQKYGGDERKALAAYNAGQGRVAGAVKKASAQGGDWLQYMPAETRKYVPSILGHKAGLER